MRFVPAGSTHVDDPIVTGGELEAAVRAARLELARVEARRDAARTELATMTWRVHRLSNVWRSPVSTATWVMVRALRAIRRSLSTHRPFRWLPTLHHGWRHYRTSVRRLRDEHPYEQSSSHGQVDAIRWIGPVSVPHTRHALFAHPDSRIAYRLPETPGGGRLVADCLVHPAAWGRFRSELTFTVTASCPATAWVESRTLTVNPSRFVADRAWRPLSIDLPDSSCPELLVTLETTGGPDGMAWSLWGEPRIEWSRPREERRRLRNAAWTRLRDHGPRAVVADLRSREHGELVAATYRRWIEQHSPSNADLIRMRERVAAFEWRPLVSIITPVYNTEPRWLRAAVESVRRQAYPHWELCLADDRSTRADTRAALDELEDDDRIKIVRLEHNGGISTASNAALRLARGELIALLDHDDELAPEALFEVVRHFNAHPEADVVYSDEDKLEGESRRCDPYFKPDWSPELFLSFMYSCHLMTFRRRVVEAIGGFRSEFDGAQDYDLLLRVMAGGHRIDHLPGVLYHWRKTGESTASAGAAKPWAADAGRRAVAAHLHATDRAADVVAGPLPGLYRVRHRIEGAPLVSIVIPTRGKTRALGRTGTDLLTNCLRSLAERTEYRPIEVILVADQPLSPGAAAAAAALDHRVIEYRDPGPFNFSRKINVGVRASAGPLVLLLNDDVEAIDPGWLSALIEFGRQPAIGAVGAKLLYPDGRLQHVGLLLGVAGVAAHAFHQHPGHSPGYAGSNIVIRNCSAVTAACMLTRRDVFDRVGGFDENLKVDFNDVDYCLKVREQGYRIVFTPYAELRHHESASFGSRTQDPIEIERMRKRWGDAVRRDPYYSPFLTHSRPDFTLDA
jgi:GT2 family glycosyltransferase